MDSVTADPLPAALIAVVGAEHVLTDPLLRASYDVDWTGRFTGRSRCVVRPGDTAQVAAVLAECARAGAGVVPQGGNTGLVGGSVARGGEVLLSLRRLTGLGPVEHDSGQVSVGAGATLAAVQQHVRAAGWDVGMDFAARDSATIGGLVATNAGGERVLRYGAMRAQVLGVETVLADGSVVRRMSGLVKDNVGYDLIGLLTGSEGTLAVITAVRLRLIRPARHRTVVVLGMPSMESVIQALRAAQDGVEGLEAAEFFLADGLALVCAHRGLPAPFRTTHPAYLLLEAAGGTDQTEALGVALPDVGDAAVATSSADRAALWAYREAHTEAINALGVPVKLDVAVPVGALARFVAELPGVVSAVAAEARTILFGHVAEGNVHVNVVGAPDTSAGGAPGPQPVTEAVLRRVAAEGGSISAEHGVGVAKVAWVGLSRTAADIAAMRAVKAALDPAGRLNPGVLFEGGS